MTTMLSQVDFCGTRVSRLILGDNPFNGHSYITDVVSGEAMLDYYTAEKCVRALFEAEEGGINACMVLGCPFILRVLRQYRNEGGRMHVLFQSYPPMELEVNLRQMMACAPIAIYHQGTTTDYLCENGQTEELRKRLALIRASGVATGLGTHVPETVLRAEREGWDVDFYATCLYNARKTQRGEQSGFITGKSKELVFYPADRWLMFDAIRTSAKPCIAFKVFAGGQVFHAKGEAEIPRIARDTVQEAYDNIKPTDLVCVGAFQRDKNQIKENAEIAKSVLQL